MGVRQFQVMDLVDIFDLKLHVDVIFFCGIFRVTISDNLTSQIRETIQTVVVIDNCRGY